MQTQLPPELAAAPFSVEQGRKAGLSPGALRSLSLDRPFHGVRRADGDPALFQRCLAYSTRMDSLAFFCGPTAAKLLGVPLPAHLEADERLHVAIPNPERAPKGVGVAGHKFVVGPGEITEWRGLRTSTPERIWCELGPIVGVEGLVIAGDYLVQNDHPLTTLERLSLMLDRYPDRRGRRRLQRAIRLLDGRSESPAETRLRLILIEHGFTGFELNVRIPVPGMSRGYRVDFAFPELKVAIEYQGGYHADDAQWRADMTRISRLEALGWRVIQVNKDDLRDVPELVARIRGMLRLARQA